MEQDPLKFAKCLVAEQPVRDDGDQTLTILQRAVHLSRAAYFVKVDSLVDKGRENGCKTSKEKKDKTVTDAEKELAKASAGKRPAKQAALEEAQFKKEPPADILFPSANAKYGALQNKYGELLAKPCTKHEGEYEAEYKKIGFRKLTLTTPWSSAPWSSKALPLYNSTKAVDEMEAPFRVLYSFDNYDPVERKGVIEIAFRGTVVDDVTSQVGLNLGKRIEGLETALFDTVFVKMPLGGGAAPFGVRRLFRCQDTIKGCPNCAHYCLAGCCVLPFDVCTAIYPIPAFLSMISLFACCGVTGFGVCAAGTAIGAASACCINADDTHGFSDWHQSSMMAKYGVDGVQATVATGFYSAAMSTIPSVEDMLNKEFGIEEDKTAKWLKMVCCAPQTGWATACSFFTGFCCFWVPGACQFCNVWPAACCRPLEQCWDAAEEKVMERRGEKGENKYLAKPPEDVTIRLTGHSLGGAVLGSNSGALHSDDPPGRSAPASRRPALLCCAACPRAAGGLSPHPGAIATIGALKLANKGWKVELVTFGSPRVGNASFSSLTKKLIEKHGGGSARFVNPGDPVPDLPPFMAKFSHIGKSFEIGDYVKEKVVGQDDKAKDAAGTHKKKAFSTEKQEQILALLCCQSNAKMADEDEATHKNKNPLLAFLCCHSKESKAKMGHGMADYEANLFNLNPKWVEELTKGFEKAAATADQQAAATTADQQLMVMPISERDEPEAPSNQQMSRDAQPKATAKVAPA